MVDYAINANRRWFQFWKPKFVKVSKYTKFMLEIFKDTSDFNLKGLTISRLFDSKMIKNPGRVWFQLWKPRRIPNPDYSPEPVEIDIVRGKPRYHFSGDVELERKQPKQVFYD